MFSQFIQGLLSSGGKSAAMQRYAALNNQVNYIKSNFGTLLLGPQAMKVNADIVKNNSMNSLTNALSEINGTTAANAYPSASGTANKAQILGMVSRVAEKYGVDEKLVKALIKQESGFNPNAT